MYRVTVIIEVIAISRRGGSASPPPHQNFTRKVQKMKHIALMGALLLLFQLTGQAEQTNDEPKKVELPVKAQLIAKKKTYTLDLGGKTGDEFRKALKEAAKTGRVPPPPAVDLELELTNTSTADVKLWTGGDPVQLNLALTGPGAETIAPLLAFTTDFRGPTATTLAPGKSVTIPIKSLKHGFRGGSQMSYWSEPGEYKVTATFKSGISPAPKGTKVNDGFGLVEIVSQTLTLTVEAK
jgi:hypothetical protein